VCVCVASAKASALNGNEGAFHLSCTTLLLKDNETRTMLRGNRIKLMRNAHKFPLQKRFANAICECDALTSLSFWPADELCLCLSVLAEITAGSRSPSPAAADPSVHHRTDATAAATDACSPAGPTDRPNDQRSSFLPSPLSPKAERMRLPWPVRHDCSSTQRQHYLHTLSLTGTR
jgi:hypothetical protein